MKELENQLRNYPRPFITDRELAFLLGGSADRRYSKIKRLIAQGKLLHIRRGLYCLTDVLGHSVKPHPFALAQYIYPSSYISFESALSYHKLIPERVYVITSACTKRSKDFQTPLGRFSYLHLPRENFFTEVELVNDHPYQFLMAKPWKAICDYVFSYKKKWSGMGPLIESLRIDQSDLPNLRDEELEALNEYYHSKRLALFLKGIKRDLSSKKIAEVLST